MSVPGPGLKPKVVATPKMEKKIAIEHYADKSGPNQDMQAVKARGEVKRPSVHAVREGEGSKQVFHAL